jgi:hypothetical protein
VKNKLLAICILSALGTASVFAKTEAHALQRNVNQQTRIENGLKDGQLTTKEAGRLEKQQSRIDQLEAKDLKDGKLTAKERAQLHRAQNRASQSIEAADHNQAKGNPESRSSERMQADVQRNVNQQTRIEHGTESGTLNGRETANLERGQAHMDRKEARAARNGRISANEQREIQSGENGQSTRIFAEKHNQAAAQPGG